MVLLQGILHIAVWDLGADTLATFSFRLDHGSYLLAGVTCVPLVKKVLKRRKLVALGIERIVIIVDGNIANSKPWECDLRVMSDLNIVSAETGEVFGNQRTDLSFFHHRHHFLESGTFEIHSRKAIVNEDLRVFKAVVLCVFFKDTALILNTVAVALEFVLL